RSVDILVICGGGQLLESSGGPWAFVGGPWQFPFTIFKWALLARLTRARCMVLNVGAGPLVRPLSKWFVRSALSLSDYASFRDEQSMAFVNHIGFKGRTYFFPDGAYSLDTPPLSSGPASKRDKVVVGLAPMAYGDPRLSPKHDPIAYNDFIR